MTVQAWNSLGALELLPARAQLQGQGLQLVQRVQEQ
jgi:hypothetical protein